MAISMRPFGTLPLSKLKPTSPRGSKLYFSTRGNGRANDDGREAMARPFADLVRSIIVMREFARPFGTHTNIIDASRSLYEVLRDRDHDPTELTSDHFLQAARLLSQQKKASTAYLQANALVKMPSS